MSSDTTPHGRRPTPRRKPATNPPVRGPLSFRYDDGGRREAGFKGSTGDCVVRAISIATGKPHGEAYRELRRRSAAKGRPSPRHGVNRFVYRPYPEQLGWTWVPTMGIGTGTTVHLAEGELPKGRVIARVSRHLVAVNDWGHPRHARLRPRRDPRGLRLVRTGHRGLVRHVAGGRGMTALAAPETLAKRRWRPGLVGTSAVGRARDPPGPHGAAPRARGGHPGSPAMHEASTS